jgi:hypothetical protein
MTLVDTINSVQNVANALNPASQSQVGSFQNDGFLLPGSFQADGNGLPYNHVPNNKPSQLKRNIMTWFIPQFGIVSMYVNPESISYQHKKLISKDRTKGGYTLQYWGEDLTAINIGGTTGSSGIEGINVLYEMYRAEQYAFDPMALTLAANNASEDLAQGLLGGVSSLLGGPSTSGGAGGLLGGILGVSSPNSALAPQNISSLAQLAFGVELYYGGWVYRGFFENMTINERSSSFAIEYQITFMATQRRGYRTNYFPFTRSASTGPSNYTTPNSFSGYVSGT